jgi:hypothetical protein
MDVLVLDADDWQALYIDGKLIADGHNLTDGEPLFYLIKAEQFGFSSEDVRFKFCNKEDEAMLMVKGSFPELLTDLNGNY